MAFGIGLWVATLVPEGAITTLPGQKAEEDTVVAAMRVDTGADDPSWTGATGLGAVELKIGHTEATRITPSTGWDQGDHLGLPITECINLGTGWATPTGLIHNQVRRQRHLGRLELTYDRRGGLAIGRAAGEGDTGTNAGCCSADHCSDTEHGRLVEANFLDGVAKGFLQPALVPGRVRFCGLVGCEVKSRKEPDPMAMGQPVRAQQKQGPLRQGDGSILIAFGAANVQLHARTVDLRDLCTGQRPFA